MVPFHFIQTWYQIIQEQVIKKGDWFQNTSLEITLWTLTLMATLQCRFSVSINSQWSLLSLSYNMFLFTESGGWGKVTTEAVSAHCIPCRFFHNLVVEVTVNWGNILTKRHRILSLTSPASFYLRLLWVYFSTEAAKTRMLEHLCSLRFQWVKPFKEHFGLG